jgi:HPt (histidine-containing phosphotransfer) domain-containing protein
LKGALARLSGSRELYVRAAKQFIESLDVSVGSLYDQIYAGNKDEYLRIIHTLKGNAALLGAEALSRATRTFELKGKAGELQGLEDSALVVLAAETTRAKGLLELAISGFDLPVSHSGSELQSLDPQAAKVILNELSCLAKASDLQVLERFAEERSTLAGLPDDILSKLEDCLQNLDLENAREICVHGLEWCEKKLVT